MRIILTTLFLFFLILTIYLISNPNVFTNISSGQVPNKTYTETKIDKQVNNNGEVEISTDMTSGETLADGYDIIKEIVYLQNERLKKDPDDLESVAKVYDDVQGKYNIPDEQWLDFIQTSYDAGWFEKARREVLSGA
ncbi:MAG: hypothetical protein HN833_00230 [Elusimicrobiaceae bacterium]|jgi:hypothetical protein|nr:hypothetical protein [Elusimicrobiaceae bacterium]MBT3954709.1 hypothetical protein [Elusimicrobiaceae bacterium]MBT4007736.1 hypothetical protein [Elusimicrobiaceae bacterium]MBT4402796.1 hypothetical protein [Elusimicrobiaceae bacterium]MBT4439413.1 hypothetical protein [Elusimicrobiaceae bacterium]